MTLSPVFRSPSAVLLLKEQGVWDRLAADMEAQATAVRQVHEDLRGILGESYLGAPAHVPTASEVTTPDGLHFLQEYFFLILFRSIFQSLGVPEDRLRMYAELNFCIKGTITAADNIFDDQAKTLLPLNPASGARFMSILQLMCFERLQRRVLDRAEERGIVRPEQRAPIQKGLLDRMAEIGVLEGSEEGGVDGIPTPEVMVERVHRIRGGALFALAFAAPSVLETGELAAKMTRAETAVARLGTAFQIVDDLTDFEFDLGRKSHNLLTSRVTHHGTAEEQQALARFLNDDPAPEGGVENLFRTSARAVLETAYCEGRASFRELADLGHWFPPDLADEVVHAIVGLDGVARMQAISTGE